jgi:hypothetical protein
MIYVIHYKFEDAGRGSSPVLRAVNEEAAMKEFLESVLGWLPEPQRNRKVGELLSSLGRGYLEVSMEDLAEELVDEGELTWDDVPELDTEAKLTVQTQGTTSNPGPKAELKRRLMS